MEESFSSLLMQLKQKRKVRIAESFGRILRILEEKWKKRCYSIYTDLDGQDCTILI